MIAPIGFRREILGTLSINAAAPNRLGPEKLALVVSAADIAGQPFTAADWNTLASTKTDWQFSGMLDESSRWPSTCW